MRMFWWLFVQRDLIETLVSFCLQIAFALVLSFIYCIVQVLVLIGLIVPIAMSDPLYCNANAIFFLLVGTTFVLCGLLHPKEIMSLVHGFTYYVAIPTMYLILMIYAVCNLHVISWGTREEKKEDATAKRSVIDKLRGCVCKGPSCGGCEQCCCTPVQIFVDTQAIRVSNRSDESMPNANQHVTASDLSEGKRSRLFVHGSLFNQLNVIYLIVALHVQYSSGLHLLCTIDVAVISVLLTASNSAVSR